MFCDQWKSSGIHAKRAPPGEFRANIHLGGTGKVVRITRDEGDLPFKRKIHGVGCCRSRYHPFIQRTFVVRSEFFTWLRRIEGATEKDIAMKIIKAVEEESIETEED